MVAHAIGQVFAHLLGPSLLLEMQRRPSKIFELPAQPATSPLDRRFSELFSPGAADDIEEAIPPFCRRTCGCCERALGSSQVFMAFNKNCAPPTAAPTLAVPRPDPNPNPHPNPHPDPQPHPDPNPHPILDPNQSSP